VLIRRHGDRSSGNGVTSWVANICFIGCHSLYSLSLRSGPWQCVANPKFLGCFQFRTCALTAFVCSRSPSYDGTVEHGSCKGLVVKIRGRRRPAFAPAKRPRSTNRGAPPPNRAQSLLHNAVTPLRHQTGRNAPSPMPIGCAVPFPAPATSCICRAISTIASVAISTLSRSTRQRS